MAESFAAGWLYSALCCTCMYLRTFGELTLEGSDLERPMRLLLLAYLTVHGPAPRAEVNELFSGPTTGGTQLDPVELGKQRAKNLTTALQQIRKEAGNDVVVRSQGTVEVALQCDALDFEAALASGDLEAAARLYTGPFLHGIEGMRYMRPERWDSELAGWVRETRLNIAAKALNLLVHLGQMNARLGAHDKAASLAERAFETLEATVPHDEYGEGRSCFKMDDLLVLHALMAVSGSRNLEGFRDLVGVYVDLELPNDEQAKDELVQADDWEEFKANEPVVGRRADTERVVAALERGMGQFVSVTGAGGVGKTTLALHVARLGRAQGRYPDGVFFVPLDGVKIPNLIPVRIAAALGLELTVTADALEQVVSHVRNLNALVVLDNFEHLLERSDVPGRLVQGAAKVQVIVTSRERLGAAEEIVCQLSGLVVHSPGGQLVTDEDGDAVSWFVQAARRRVPDAEFGEASVAVIASLCRFLEGHPLAIQLAAQLTDFMPLEDIERRIRADVAVLDHTTSDGTGQLRSLRATWESSWAALKKADHLPLSSLSAFRGGFTWEAVMDVANVDISQLRTWIDRSLVQVVGDHRLDIHPTLRPLLLSKLRMKGEGEAVAARHSDYFLRSAEEYAPQLNGDLARSALGFFAAEHANLRAAWEHERSGAALLRFSRVLLIAQSRLGDIESRFSLLTRAREANESEGNEAAVAELTNGIADTLLQRGEIDAAHGELVSALERPYGEAAASVRAETLSQLGGVHYLRREYEEALNRFEEARAIHERLRDQGQSAAELANIGAVYYQQGNVREAVSIWGKALTGHRRAGDLERQALALNNLGAAYQLLGEFERAQVSLEKAKELNVSLGDELGADVVSVNLGAIAFQRGYYTVSRSTNVESLELHRRTGNAAGVALALTNLAMLDERQGSLEAAQGTLLEALRLQEKADERMVRAATLYNASTVTLQLGNPERAAALALEAVELAQETGNVIAEGYAQLFLGDALEAKRAGSGNARLAYEKARDCFGGAGDLVGSLTTQLRLAPKGAPEAWLDGAQLAGEVLEAATKYDLLPLALEAAYFLANAMRSVGSTDQQAEAASRVRTLTEQLKKRATQAQSE